MTSFFRDMGFAFAQLRRRPGFTAVAVLTLALGIGANTAIWSVVQGVLLSPLRYPHPEQLMTVWENRAARGGPEQEFTGKAVFEDWRTGNQTFQAMAVFDDWQPTLTGRAEPEQLAGGLASDEYFTVLGVRPAMGRAFLPSDGRMGAPRVALLADALWRRRFDTDPAVLGKAIELDGETHTVVGVLPAGFKAPFVQAEIWRPVQIEAAPQDRGNHYLRVIGRLRDGVEMPKAQADLRRVAAGIAERDPQYYSSVGVTLVSLHRQLVGVARSSLLVLLGAVGLVLLIACANVANLLLARATARAREVAVRTALGAGRARLVRQLLTESSLLALAGGAAGMILGSLGTSALRSLAPAQTPRLEEVTVDLRVLLFTLGLALATGLLFGLAPALHATRPDLASALKEGSHGAGMAHGGGRLRGFLVAGEVALALTLATGAGMLIHNFSGLLNVSPGIQPRNVLTANVSLPVARYKDPASQARFFTELLARLQARSGVVAAGAIPEAPFSGSDNDNAFTVEGQAPPAKGHEPDAWIRRVSPGYFQALGLAVVAGRPLSEQDRATSERVVVVNRTLQQRIFHGAAALGHRLRLGSVNSKQPWARIVGVVADVRHRGLDTEPEVEIYVPHEQLPAAAMTVVIKAAGDPLQMVPALRAEVRALDPNLPVSGIATMDELIANSLAVPRFVGLLLTVFAALALALAAVGIYGVTAYSVGQRRHEIGVRVALGAGRRQVVRTVLGRGMVPAAWGMLVGLGCAYAMSRAMGSLLSTVSPTDPTSFAGAALLLGGVSLIANYLPAQRAAATDAARALRTE
ncbi:MAG TPA: ABC transporter permease [Thermoanaerobaculia bacterium]|nr:ABC transporter permease [Thermoanaerobaculia bacterium]